MAKKPMSMYEEADTAPTDQEVANSIPSNDGGTYVKLPEGVVPFVPKTFFEKHEAEEKATCEMLVLPFSVDQHSLKVLPPVYTEHGYLNKAFWRLNNFMTHEWVNTAEGPRTIVCPQSVGAQPKGLCPLCDKRVERLNDIKADTGVWDATKLPKEFGRQKNHSCFLAYINNTDKVYYVEQRAIFKTKNSKGKEGTKDPKPTFFDFLASAQEAGSVGLKGFWAMGSKPIWLRIQWKYTSGMIEGRKQFWWDILRIDGAEVSLSGIKASDVMWDKGGDPAYNVCHMVQIPSREEVQKIADGIVAFKPKKEKSADDVGDPCYEDIKDLDVSDLYEYAKKHNVDLSAVPPEAPKRFVMKEIMNALKITPPA